MVIQQSGYSSIFMLAVPSHIYLRINQERGGRLNIGGDLVLTIHRFDLVHDAVLCKCNANGSVIFNIWILGNAALCKAKHINGYK